MAKKKFTMKITIEDSCATYEYLLDNPDGRYCIYDYVKAMCMHLGVKLISQKYVSSVLRVTKKGKKNVGKN